MAKIVSRAQATRVGNCKKIAQMCQKEVRRTALKSGRSARDIQAKAKRAMREVSKNIAHYFVHLGCLEE